jgi:hypothetical protein
MTNDTKLCTCCRMAKPLSAFAIDRQQGDGLACWCRDCRGLQVARKIREYRLTVLHHYSDGRMCCACCGEDALEFLAIDHIHGDGASQREITGEGGNFYRWVIRHDFPPGLQVLCHNCNIAKSFYGWCPHRRGGVEHQPVRHRR